MSKLILLNVNSNTCSILTITWQIIKENLTVAYHLIARKTMVCKMVDNKYITSST